MNNKMRLERLRNLRRVLRKVAKLPKERFDLNVVAVIDDCGTVACSAGWAGLDPWFRRRGFVTKVSGRTSSWDACRIGQHHAFDGYGRLMDFFGIDTKEASRIFHGGPNGNYVATAAEVADEVTRVIEKYRREG